MSQNAVNTLIAASHIAVGDFFDDVAGYAFVFVYLISAQNLGVLYSF